MSFNFLAFILLFCGLLVLWVPRAKQSWPYFALGAIVIGFWQNLLGIYGLIATVTFVGLCLALRYKHPKTPKYILWIFHGGLILLSLALALHLIPGFQPLILYENIHFSEASSAYTIRYHFDKAIAGFLLIALLTDHITEIHTWKKTLKALLPFLLVSIGVLTLLGLALDELTFDPKLSQLILWWALGNLLITCIAEEAFFRLLIQQKLQSIFSNHYYGAQITIGLCALLFGLAHMAGGWVMMLGATVAGLIYAYIYHRTGRVEASILLHFSFNLAHILLFTYPRAI